MRFRLQTPPGGLDEGSGNLAGLINEQSSGFDVLRVIQAEQVDDQPVLRYLRKRILGASPETVGSSGE